MMVNEGVTPYRALDAPVNDVRVSFIDWMS
jgi:hypothetical protein